jgi:3-dehydroquinate dehydratase/shikimate dehydrogenase
MPKERLIVLAMGELGFPTRVLSPVFGGIFTYAAPMFASGTAAGQVSSRFLRHLYRVEKLGKSAKIYGVIADPVRHSISPAVHNRASKPSGWMPSTCRSWSHRRTCGTSSRSRRSFRFPGSA